MDDNLAMRLEYNRKALLVREISSLMIHALELSKVGDYAKVHDIATELAEFLDRKPNEMFGLTFDQLFEAVVYWRMRRSPEDFKLSAKGTCRYCGHPLHVAGLCPVKTHDALNDKVKCPCIAKPRPTRAPRLKG